MGFAILFQSVNSSSSVTGTYLGEALSTAGTTFDISSYSELLIVNVGSTSLKMAHGSLRIPKALLISEFNAGRLTATYLNFGTITAISSSSITIKGSGESAYGVLVYGLN